MMSVQHQNFTSKRLKIPPSNLVYKVIYSASSCYLKWSVHAGKENILEFFSSVQNFTSGTDYYCNFILKRNINQITGKYGEQLKNSR